MAEFGLDLVGMGGKSAKKEDAARLSLPEPEVLDEPGAAEPLGSFVCGTEVVVCECERFGKLGTEEVYGEV